MAEQGQQGSTTVSALLWRVERLEDSVDKHDTDLYKGNGKPSLTIRTNNLENRMDARDKKDDRMHGYVVTGLFLLLATFLTLLGNLFMKHL